MKRVSFSRRWVGSLYLSVAGPGSLVESRPELRTELGMAAPGGHGTHWRQGGYPKLADSVPNSTRCPYIGHPPSLNRTSENQLKTREAHSTRLKHVELASHFARQVILAVQGSIVVEAGGSCVLADSSRHVLL